jgi:DNA-binding LacI/PurR family transcriptional regulator
MGKKEIRKVILELGDSFCGLILTPLHQHLSGFSDWCSWLLKFAKPLVWLQDYEPQQIVAQPHPNFYRVNYGAWVNPDMETEADLALKEIFNKGHRKVVFACNDPKVYHWFRLRLQGFLKSKYASGVEIIALEKTISDAALMKLVLQVADITCLIVPNDRYAIRYWQVLTEMGIKIPRDLSMISFDNLADLHPFPISSVDFGMANLGYKVIHILLNDIPVETIKKTHLMGLCQLIDRGSVGTPRKNIRLGDKD